MSAPRVSCELLLPGPQPPVSHFGVTLLRHAVAGGLRYSLYHLGMPLPERPPVRIGRLRLTLAGGPVESLLGGSAAGAAVAGALLDPGGIPSKGESGRGLARLLGAARFHRWRLRLFSSRRFPHGEPAPGDSEPGAIWRELGRRLSKLQRTLSEAFLAEVAASLGRRAARARGGEAPPCLSLEAWRLLSGRRVRLEALGPPDPLSPSWAGEPKRARRAAAGSSGTPPPSHPLRGRFRERWREALDILRAPYLALAESAVGRGLLESAEDAFFLPFDLAPDLALDPPPSWMAAAVAANRREYEALLETADDWSLTPLWPLP